MASIIRESIDRTGTVNESSEALALDVRHSLAGPTVEGFRERPATAVERELPTA